MRADGMLVGLVRNPGRRGWICRGMKAIEYIYLAIGTGALGTAMTFGLLFACRYYGIDIWQNIWVLAIPLGLSLVLNISLIELYSRVKKKQ